MELASGIFKTVLENLHEGVYFVDEDRQITFWNRSAETISGYTSGELVGLRSADDVLIHVDENGDALADGNCPITLSMQTGAPSESQVWLQHREGHRVPMRVRTTPIYDDQGKLLGAAEIFEESSKARAELQILSEEQQEALYCPITKVGSRKLIELNLEARNHEHKRFRTSFGLAFLHIDQAEAVRNKFGKDAAEALMRIVAKTLAHCIRPFDTLGHWDDNRFCVLAGNLNRVGLRRAVSRWTNIVRSLQLNAGESVIQPTVSVGASAVRLNDEPAALIERAWELMNDSLEKGGNQIYMDSQG